MLPYCGLVVEIQPLNCKTYFFCSPSNVNQEKEGGRDVQPGPRLMQRTCAKWRLPLRRTGATFAASAASKRVWQAVLAVFRGGGEGGWGGGFKGTLVRFLPPSRFSSANQQVKKWGSTKWQVWMGFALNRRCVLFTCCFFIWQNGRMAVWLKFSTPRQFSSGTTCGRHTTAAAHIIGKRSRCWGQLVVGGIRWCGRVCWAWLSTYTSST